MYVLQREYKGFCCFLCIFYTHIRQMVRKSIYLTFTDVLQAMSISMLITMDSRKGFCLVSPPCHYLFLFFSLVLTTFTLCVVEVEKILFIHLNVTEIQRPSPSIRLIVMIKYFAFAHDLFHVRRDCTVL